MSPSVCYYSCLGMFIAASRKYYLHDLCLPLLDHPRYYDDRLSKDEADSEKTARQSFIRYLENSIQILAFMGEYSRMNDFSDLLEKSIDVFKSEKKDVMLDIIKGSDSIQDSILPLIANTIYTVYSLEEKEFKQVEKQTNKYKLEGLGNSDRLANLITGKNNEADYQMELKKLHNKFCLFTLNPTEDQKQELQSSHLAQMFGITPLLLQRAYFRQLKIQGEQLKSVYLNFKSRKLFKGDTVAISEVPNFMRKACHVPPFDLDSRLAVRGIHRHHHF